MIFFSIGRSSSAERVTPAFRLLISICPKISAIAKKAAKKAGVVSCFFCCLVPAPSILMTDQFFPEHSEKLVFPDDFYLFTLRDIFLGEHPFIRLSAVY